MTTYREGFFRHPEDCTKFYRCVDRSRTLRSFQIFFFRDEWAKAQELSVITYHTKSKSTNMSTFSIWLLKSCVVSVSVVEVEKFCDLCTF